MKPATPLLVLSGDDVRSVFTVGLAIDSQRQAFRALGTGTALLPPRVTVDGLDGSVAFCYAARLAREGPAVSKFGSFNPANARAGYPAISAVVLVLDPVTGRPAALIDGSSITEMRTAAASAVASGVLAPQARVAAVIGSGVQGVAHLRALDHQHELAQIRLHGINRGQVDDVVSTLSRELTTPVVAVGTAQEATTGADLIALCTTSPEPVIQSNWVDDGATVISVGSFEAQRHEVPQDLLHRAAAVVVDDKATAEEFAGPVVTAIRNGLLSPASIRTLGQILVSGGFGRENPSDIVYYNSVGIGVQDAAAADAILSAARQQGVGHALWL